MGKCRLVVVAFFLIAVILVMSFNIAFAHPGSLDENGGHYNRTTGEYHFHHGYPAHQHVNGVCPYNFDDKTNTDYNGGGSSTTQTRRSPIASPRRTYAKTNTPKPTATPKSNLSFNAFMGWLTIAVFFVFPLLSGIFSVIKNWVQNRILAHKAKKQNQLIYSNHKMSDFVHPPEGCYIGSDGLPHSSSNYAEDIYIIYISKYGKKYHRNFGCSGAGIRINAYNAPRTLLPCSKCHPSYPDLSWYSEYSRILKSVKKCKAINFVDDLRK